MQQMWAKVTILAWEEAALSMGAVAWWQIQCPQVHPALTESASRQAVQD